MPLTGPLRLSQLQRIVALIDKDMNNILQGT